MSPDRREMTRNGLKMEIPAFSCGQEDFQNAIYFVDYTKSIRLS